MSTVAAAKYATFPARVVSRFRDGCRSLDQSSNCAPKPAADWKISFEEVIGIRCFIRSCCNRSFETGAPSYPICGLDRRGFGASDGPLGPVPSLSVLLDDYLRTLAIAHM